MMYKSSLFYESTLFIFYINDLCAMKQYKYFFLSTFLTILKNETIYNVFIYEKKNKHHHSSNYHTQSVKLATDYKCSVILIICVWVILTKRKRILVDDCSYMMLATLITFFIETIICEVDRLLQFDNDNGPFIQR